MDSSKIKFSAASELHMVRHFQNVSHELTQRLITAGYHEREWKSFLRAPGSRFYASFATELSELFQQIQRGNISESTGANGNKVVAVSFSKKDFPAGVGSLGILPICELQKEQASLIYMKENRGVPLHHLDVDILPSTQEATVILKPEKEDYIFITAFPGPAAMPLPADGMPSDLHAACVRFWDQHVFLVQR
jgi:hypothetical protein